MESFQFKNKSTFTRLTGPSLYNKNFGVSSNFVDEYSHLVDPPPAAASDWQLFE